jgi:Ino eighty subunit 1
LRFRFRCRNTVVARRAPRTTHHAPPAAHVAMAMDAEPPDSRNSLAHILAAEPAMDDARPSPSLADTPAPDDGDLADAPEGSKHAGDSDGARPYYTSTTTTTRRNANGSVSSVYSGNKIKHLKKDDGIPLWRKDIQYDFLKLVFEDDRTVFTKQSEPQAGPTHTFADIYLDAMAKSSKCSKILKDKLLTERPAAVNMAMVCLLVNVGRMNTTLNFFPEMRAQLRTYHSIPSLQAHQDPNAYKQLQDAPRLKSILKGATEDQEQPSTVDEIMQASIPRTNPVNLIFVLSQYAPKISELHFFPPRDFFDLVMRSNLSSKSRATAFLWLMWWYLESDFTKEAAERNPFGPGQFGPADDPITADNPLKCPPFEFLSPEAEALENVDTVDEKTFGEIKRKERIAILASDMAPVVTGPKRTNKKGECPYLHD